MKYTHRYIARVILEAETPLFVGSGETSLLKDALVQKDHFGFPMIQGTSLMGVLRHALEKDKTEWKHFFGYQSGKNGTGAQVKVSAAYLILDDEKIAEGLTLSAREFELLDLFDELPSRQHVRISDKGAAEKQALFDNEVVYQGCRFLFELEVKGNGNERGQWSALLNQLASPLFRLGQGTRNGYGKLKVISCKTKEFDLSSNEHFNDYLAFNPSFNATNPFLSENLDDLIIDKSLTQYTLSLKQDSFFIFSAGYSDTEVDNVPLREKVVEYDSGKMIFVEKTVIPASSIKGAISHRTAFHYNKRKEKWADNLKEAEMKELVGTNNDAVYHLFGKEAGDKERPGQRGKVILNDSFYDDVNNEKIFNHVAIDRFTGGTIDGALFSEKVSRKENGLEINLWLDSDISGDEKIQMALEDALQDICKGLLPLGGMTTKGHGIFTGKLFKNKKEIFDYEKI